MKKIELLAPAGNFDCLIAAVQSGADAVYLSGKAFGARSFADNFDNPQLEEAVDYCHIRNTKVYVTVNTLVSDSEMPALNEYLVFLNNIGVDAIIVQDMGVIQLAGEIVPELPIHASTQMTVHNSNGVELLEELGVKRVVLSREVSLKNIKKIAEKTNAELEVFAHGALCMCYSGQCLMSSIIGGRSGNRGKCAQPCRLPYSINDGKTKKFFMSLKDLCSINYISKLSEIGVTSLKIEGRMKGAAYVAAVVGIYRKYIDNPHPAEKADVELLDRIFNRGGVTAGYLTGKTGKEMFALDKPDNPYLKASSTLEQALLNKIKTENRKMLVKCDVKIRREAHPMISVSGGNVSVDFVSDTVTEKAKKLPLTTETVSAQLRKTGGTPFDICSLNIELDEGAFVTVGTLNSMRRAAFEKFEKEYAKSFKRQAEAVNTADFADVAGVNVQCEFVCEVTSFEQLMAVKNEDFTKFYIPLHIIEQNISEIEKIKNKTVIVLPSITHEDCLKNVNNRAEKLLKRGFFAVLASNISHIKHFSDYKVYGGFRLNIYNSDALSFYKKLGLQAAELSPELNLRQIQKIKKVFSVQTMVYGRLPLMLCENCIIQNGSKCSCEGNNSITDRMGMVFPVIKDGSECRSVVLNCKKTFMGFDIEKLKKAGIDLFRIYFTDETPEECLRICDTFFRNADYRPDDFTGGHYAKGVL